MVLIVSVSVPQVTSDGDDVIADVIRLPDSVGWYHQQLVDVGVCHHLARCYLDFLKPGLASEDKKKFFLLGLFSHRGVFMFSCFYFLPSLPQ